MLFDDEGNPAGVERIGYALEPEEPYELRPAEGTGGCEDPRVTYVDPLGLYVMSYVAWGPKGPRIALAISEDLLKWERLGLVSFQPDVQAKYNVIFNNYHNKDAAFFPAAITLQDGTDVLGMLHRPFYDTVKTAPKGIREPVPIFGSPGASSMRLCATFATCASCASTRYWSIRNKRGRSCASVLERRPCKRRSAFS